MSRTLTFSLYKCVFTSISICLLLALTASAQTRNRIAQRIENTEHSVVAGAHPMARPEFDQGRVNGSMKINRAAMVFKLAPAQQAALNKLLAEQQDPKSANYHKWLTPEQYAARFGMSEADLAKVTSWLQSQGLTVDGVSRGRTEVFFSGTAAQVETVPLQLAGDDRSDRRDRRPAQRGQQPILAAAHRGRLEQPGDLRRAGEGDRIDPALAHFLDQSGDLSAVGSRHVSVGHDRVGQGAGLPQKIY